MEDSSWLGQLDKFRSIYDEIYLKLADKVDALQADHKTKMEQLQSKHEKKLYELKYRLQCSKEKNMKISEQIDETNKKNSMLKECLVDLRKSE